MFTLESARGKVVAVERVVVVASVAAALLSLGGCTQGATNAPPQVSCDDVVASVIQRERTNDTSGRINTEIQWLADHCSEGYDIAVGYISESGMARSELGPNACQFLLDHDFHPTAVEMLSQDGLCIEDSADADAGVDWRHAASGGEVWPDGGVAWNEAVNYVGTNKRVCGPLVSIRGSNDDVFLNIGHDFDNPNRFIIVLWDVGELVSVIDAGTTVCASGVIELYEGAAEIQLRDAGEVEIWR
ncbi:hypothetical protein [Demequina sp.]|uniref:hypothetical protein n=1 Tax=Demequina sp. TaxID=2050685 RepID=UPI003D0A7095